MEEDAAIMIILVMGSMIGTLLFEVTHRLRRPPVSLHQRTRRLKDVYLSGTSVCGVRMGFWRAHMEMPKDHFLPLCSKIGC